MHGLWPRLIRRGVHIYTMAYYIKKVNKISDPHVYSGPHCYSRVSNRQGQLFCTNSCYKCDSDFEKVVGHLHFQIRKLYSFFPGFLISKAADFNLMGMQDHPFYLHFEIWIWLRSKVLQWEACGMKLTSQAITLLYYVRGLGSNQNNFI